MTDGALQMNAPSFTEEEEGMYETRKHKVEDTATVNLIFESGALCTLNISDTIVAPWSYELTAGENPAYPVTN